MNETHIEFVTLRKDAKERATAIAKIMLEAISKPLPRRRNCTLNQDGRGNGKRILSFGHIPPIHKVAKLTIKARGKLTGAARYGGHMPAYGTFFWNQLVTPDQEKCGDFYCRLIGWNRRAVNAGPFGSYTIFSSGGVDVGGMMNATTEYSRSRPPWWQAFIAVADVDACASSVPALGGTVIEPPHDIPGVGRACMVADPSGAVVQLITPVSVTP